MRTAGLEEILSQSQQKTPREQQNGTSASPPSGHEQAGHRWGENAKRSTIKGRKLMMEREVERSAAIGATYGVAHGHVEEQRAASKAAALNAAYGVQSAGGTTAPMNSARSMSGGGDSPAQHVGGRGMVILRPQSASPLPHGSPGSPPPPHIRDREIYIERIRSAGGMRSPPPGSIGSPGTPASFHGSISHAGSGSSSPPLQRPSSSSGISALARAMSHEIMQAAGGPDLDAQRAHITEGPELMIVSQKQQTTSRPTTPDASFRSVKRAATAEQAKGAGGKEGGMAPVKSAPQIGIERLHGGLPYRKETRPRSSRRLAASQQRNAFPGVIYSVDAMVESSPHAHAHPMIQQQQVLVGHGGDWRGEAQ